MAMAKEKSSKTSGQKSPKSAEKSAGRGTSQMTPLVKGVSHYIEITSRVAIVTVSVIALLAVPAYFLDQKFQTFPWIFVIALLISMPLSLYMVFRVIKDLMQKKYD